MARVATIPLNFVTHHPQGMVKFADRIFLSSVEIIERTQRFESPRDGLDRTPGRGRGHLFEIDLQGNLRAAHRDSSAVRLLMDSRPTRQVATL